MKKLCMLILGLIASVNAYAYSYVFNDCVLNDFYIENYAWHVSDKLETLYNMGGLLFYKDYGDATGHAVDADYSRGSRTGVFTCARTASKPNTYIDSAGVIQKTIAPNEPRSFGGYYDETGFHARNLGKMLVECSITNLLTYTDGTNVSGSGSNEYWTGWGAFTTTGITSGTSRNCPAQTLFNVSGSRSQRMVYDGIGEATNGRLSMASPATAVGSFVQNDYVAASVYIKVNSNAYNKKLFCFIDALDAAGSHLSYYNQTAFTPIVGQWFKATYTVQLTDAAVSRATVTFRTEGTIATGEAIDFEIMCPQLEKGNAAMTFVPTATASLTSATEVLEYAGQGNMSDEQTVFVSTFPLYTFAATGFISGNQIRVFNTRTSTVTGNRIFVIQTADGSYNTFSSNGSVGRYYSVNTKNNPYVFALRSRHTSSPYLAVYRNGVIGAAPTTSDYPSYTVEPYFRIGSANDGSYASRYCVRYVAIFNRALSDAEIVTVTNLLTI